jgi:hypothetical protein
MNTFEYLQNKVSEFSGKKNMWKGTRFEKVRDLTCDEVGQIGEDLIYSICNKNIIECIWDKKKLSSLNDNGKVYDMLIGGKKIEVKTARLGEQGSFQHENLRNTGESDFWVFVDIAPNNIYVTVLKDFDLSLQKEHAILGKKAHLRKKAFDQYKLDFSPKTISNCIKAGITIKITENDDLYKIGKFLRAKIITEPLESEIYELTKSLNYRLSLLT